MKVMLYAIVAGVCLAVSFYSLMGVWQAASLFSGGRAMANYQFWGPLTILFFAAAVFFGYRALRLSLLRVKKSLGDDTR